METVRIPYTLVIDFDTTINAGGVGSAKSDIDADGDFIIEREAVTLYLPSANTSIAGTPAANEASVTTANNTFMTLAHFRVERRITDGQWQNAPVRVSNIIRPNGDGFDLTQRRIAAGQTVTVKLYNDSAENVRGQWALHGFKIIRK